MAYSNRPLHISIFIGLVISVLSFLAMIALILIRLNEIAQVPGWLSIIVSLYLLGGIIITNLGILGYYIGKTFDESKRRPLYTIENVLNNK
jgi:dolichol-phosphate mannosyltransferase